MGTIAPSLLHHPMSHDALHQQQPAADRWLLRCSLLVRLYKVKRRDGEHHRRIILVRARKRRDQLQLYCVLLMQGRILVFSGLTRVHCLECF